MVEQPDPITELYAKFDALGIAHATQEHAPVFTVEEAAHLYESQPGGHTKNLFLKDRKDGLWLVVCRDDLAVDLKELSKMLNAPRFSFGSGELLVETLGVQPARSRLSPSSTTRRTKCPWCWMKACSRSRF